MSGGDYLCFPLAALEISTTQLSSAKKKLEAAKKKLAAVKEFAAAEERLAAFMLNPENAWKNL
jgi:hypothetical protein